ncbi:alcohol acetyltransferase [Dactylonectria estremocensis]|uniref:Alcohol acetyltransferase n=1 Tax=Dactylonectria estremocensis TaxID=1079267 RepID=A0A9P9DY34_9HYPO|nr:alcohol acetyltransferase [Dactylonectria estremocensis]
MMNQKEFLRYASPNEQRTISREDAGFYNAVVVGGVYEFNIDVDLKTPQSFFHPLTRCILKIPFLNVVVGDKHTDGSFYQRISNINLNHHISIVHDSADTDSAVIQKVLEIEVDKPFPSDVPAWRIVVLPLTSGRCFIAFSFSHTIGDGLSGPSFHQTFLEACNALPDVVPPHIVETLPRPLPAPFDTPERLPISWSFLLAPLIAVLVPKVVAKLLGVQPTTSAVGKGSWTGSRISFDPDAMHSKMRVFEIKESLVRNAIAVSRKHGAKLTGTIHQLIVRALSQSLSDPKIINFISQTAINMRKSVGIPQDEMGEFASGCYVSHARSSAVGPLTEEEWAAAAESTRKFAASAVQLKDQPIGLLRYLPSIRKWTLSKQGEMRDCSYEVSNIGSVDGGADDADVKITKMIFTQPGHVAGAPLTFNIASIKGEGLMCTVTWNPGALEIAEGEGQFVDRVCASLQEGFNDLA